MACERYRISDEYTARVTARAMRYKVRFDCSAVYCEECDAYHVRSDDRRVEIDKAHFDVLKMLAQGMRDAEIAEHLGLSRWQVVRCVDRLTRRFNALSRPNLVAIVTALGIINLSTFVADIRDGERTTA